jgi:hemerythrin superfamily protein
MALSFTSQEGNAVELLRKDHEKVKSLFRDFESARDDNQKRRIVQQAVAELEVHATVEERVFYPAVRQDSPDAEDKLDESLEEHHVAKFLMHELKDMSPKDERFDAKFRVLAENVKHHIKEEEAELFARARTGKLDLVELGKRIEAAKSSAHSSSKQSKAQSAKKVSPNRKRNGPSASRSKPSARKSKKRATA